MHQPLRPKCFVSASSLALLTASVILTPSYVIATNESASVIPGEVVIKLVDDFPECAHCLLAQGRGFAQSTGRHILDQLRLKHGIHHIEPLFGGIHAAEQRRPAQRHGGRRSSADRDDLLRPQHIYLVRGRPGTAVESLATDLQRDPAVEWVEPNYIYRSNFHPTGVGHLAAPHMTNQDPAFPDLPDDPFLHSSGSWGQDFADLWGIFQIQAPAAWPISQGEGVIVAVVDSGLDIEHPDIAANVWSNDGEIPGNGIDDDGNGYVDDVYGWDFTTCVFRNENGICREPKSSGPDVRDFAGHGTHVAGIIAATGNNGVGIIGVAPQSLIMSVKGLDATGTGSGTELAEAVIYAAESGAHIINASWSGPPSNVIREAVTYVQDTFDVVFITGSGNDGVPIERGVSPANLLGVITTGSIAPDGQRSPFSNFGGSLDLMAPGGGDQRTDADPFAARSVLSLLSHDAVESDGFAATCHTRCALCEDGSRPIDAGEVECVANLCLEDELVCIEHGCYRQCLRCSNGIDPIPGMRECPFNDNSCVDEREVCPPGPWVVSPGYVRAHGTSMATAYVSGVAALICSFQPSFNRHQVRQALRKSARGGSTSAWDPLLGYGTVDAPGALEADELPIAEIQSPRNRVKLWERDFPIQITGLAAGGGLPLSDWQLVLREGQNGTPISLATGNTDDEGILLTLTMDGNPVLARGRRYTLELHVTDMAGNTAFDTATFLIPNPRYAAVPLANPVDAGISQISLSASGERLALRWSPRDPPPQPPTAIQLYELPSRHRRSLVPGVSPVLSPDGNTLFYTTNTEWIFHHLLTGIESRFSDPTGPLSGLVRDRKFLDEPGRTLAFIGRVHSTGATQLFEFDTLLGQLSQLTHVPAGTYPEFTLLNMSHDGQKLAFTANVPLDPTAILPTGTGIQPQYAVFLYNRQTEQIRQLTNRNGDGPPIYPDQSPAISGSGSHIAFHSSAGLTVMDLATEHSEIILPPQNGAILPMLSEDGSLVAFAAELDLDPEVMNEDLSPEVFLMDLHTQQVSQVTDRIDFPYWPYEMTMDATGSVFAAHGALGPGIGGVNPGDGILLQTRYPNHAPILDAPTYIVAPEGRVTQVLLRATDPDDDPITFWVQRIPAFTGIADNPGRLRDLARSYLTENGDGSATLEFHPRFNEAGTYPLRIAAFDGVGGIDVVDTTLVIEDTQPEGDADCDGKLTTDDVGVLVHALFNATYAATCPTTDTNADGRVLANDVTALIVKLSLDAP